MRTLAATVAALALLTGTAAAETVGHHHAGCVLVFHVRPGAVARGRLNCPASYASPHVRVDGGWPLGDAHLSHDGTVYTVYGDGVIVRVDGRQTIMQITATALGPVTVSIHVTR